MFSGLMANGTIEPNSEVVVQYCAKLCKLCMISGLHNTGLSVFRRERAFGCHGVSFRAQHSGREA